MIRSDGKASEPNPPGDQEIPQILAEDNDASLGLCRRLRSQIAKVAQPLFNRCTIMLTRDYTLHGYLPIQLPEGEYRRSVAAYAYTHSTGQHGRRRSTVWYPEKGILKRCIGRFWPELVRIKNRFFGSGTARNI